MRESECAGWTAQEKEYSTTRGMVCCIKLRVLIVGGRLKGIGVGSWAH